MLVVAALGGNALLQRGQPLTAEAQRVNVKVAAKALAGIIHAGHRLVITHGNGPQVGLLALQGAAYRPDEAYPLDVLGAETAGMIGYMIEQELENALGHDRPVATLLTQVLVDPRDPGFANPTKPVGPVYNRTEAETLAKARDWQIAPDGDKWRRVVASPKPMEIPDTRVIALLLDAGVVVICTGGGGIPVIRRADGSLIGIEAVVDKDASSALLARSLKADALLLLTDVDAVYRDFGEPNATRIAQVTPEDACKLEAPEGSMAPKLRAAAEFASGGGIAAIGRLADAERLLNRDAGTLIANNSNEKGKAMARIFSGILVAAAATTITLAISTAAEADSHMMRRGLTVPQMDAANGRALFASKGCVVCHSVNGIGGEDAQMLGAEFMDNPMSPFEFAARMWRGAEEMVTMQREELGAPIELTGQELADIIAFVHDPAEQAKLSHDDIPDNIEKLIAH